MSAMIRAATEVFIEAGFVGARMGDIADRARVAVQTVYFTFHTKAELLQACFDFAVLGPERRPPMEQAFFADLLAARSGRAALAAFVRGNTAILNRAAAIKEVAASARHEPDAVSVVARSERLRREGLAHVVGVLADRFSLRAGLTRRDATDLLLMLSSDATYLTLRSYGWSEKRYVEWLTETLTEQLLGRRGRRA
jgi:AcrR family transcriptional regulator